MTDVKRKMKIAIVASGNIETSQIGTSIRRIAYYRGVKPLHCFGHEVHFFDSANAKPLDNDKFCLHKISHPNFLPHKITRFRILQIALHLNMIFFSASLFFKILRPLKKKKFDIIHVHDRYDALSILLAKKLTFSDVPLIFNCHTSDWQNENLSSLYRILLFPEILALKYSTMTLAASQTQRSNIIKKIGINEKKVKVIYPGVNKLIFRPATPDTNNNAYVVCVGDILERKNQLVLVRAMPTILRHFPDCKLILIGGLKDKTYLEKLKNSINRLQLVNYVDIKGRVSEEELISWIHKACVCAIPSLMEGLPAALLEALSCKKAVVASNIPEISELNAVSGRETFLMASPYKPEEWSSQIVNLLKDDKKRHECEANADDVVYDQLEEARGYEQAYKEAIALSVKIR